jgi:hypothetical protein
MTGEAEIIEALPNAFWMVLLLTGNVEAAEAALLDGIAALESHHISSDDLLLATARSAIHRRIEIAEQSEGLSLLPAELRRLFLLAPNYRDCFVLRTLIGLSPELCSGILHLSIYEVEDAHCRALQELPFIDKWNIARGGSVHPGRHATPDRGENGPGKGLIGTVRPVLVRL